MKELSKVNTSKVLKLPLKQINCIKIVPHSPWSGEAKKEAPMHNGCLDQKLWTKNHSSATAGNFFVNKIFSEREKYADIFRYKVFWLKWIFACVRNKRLFCP